MMRYPNIENEKRDLHEELQLRYREFFESKLALELSKVLRQSSSVTKISSAISQLITTHKNTIKNAVRDNPKIISNLREPFFGALYDSKEEVDVNDVVDKMHATLSDAKADFSSTMQIHSVFVHYIYEHIEKSYQKSELVQSIFPDTLFSNESRGRVERESKSQATTQMGITTHPVFMKKIGNSDKQHTRALDNFRLNCHSAFFQSTIKKSIPAICGPSGHAGSFMLGAKLYGELTEDELKEYALAAFSFLGLGGNHSFHEVMMVANLVGVDFESGNYLISFPFSLQSTELFKKLINEFPEFLVQKEEVVRRMGL